MDGHRRRKQTRALPPMRARSIFVACPGGVATGGPELLHQLVSTLRKFGVDAFISYTPLDRNFECRQEYAIYGCPQAKPTDCEQSLVVLSEMETPFVRTFRKAQLAIWWLSVDNYFQIQHDSVWKDLKSYVTWLLRGGRAYIHELRRCRHFCQSAYAADFLQRHGLNYEYLTDYLGSSHFVGVEPGASRNDTIMYNPKKGAARTRRLMKVNPALKFQPIRGMSAADVRRALERAKIYVDLGAHPGKDRLPREAAMAGCCVITGRRGSAGFFADVPIPEKYKIDDRQSSFASIFGATARDIFENFEMRQRDFEGYRETITSEQQIFERQVREAFLSD